MNVALDKKDEEIDNLKKELEQLKNNKQQNDENKSDNDINGGQPMGDTENQTSTIMEKSSVSEESTKHNEEESIEELEEKSDKEIIKDQIKKPSHFINL